MHLGEARADADRLVDRRRGGVERHVQLREPARHQQRHATLRHQRQVRVRRHRDAAARGRAAPCRRTAGASSARRGPAGAVRSRAGYAATMRWKSSNGMNASGPCGGPSRRNWIAHMRQRRLHCPTGSSCRYVGSGGASGAAPTRAARSDCIRGTASGSATHREAPEDRQRRNQRRRRHHLEHVRERLARLPQPPPRERSGDRRPARQGERRAGPMSRPCGGDGRGERGDGRVVVPRGMRPDVAAVGARMLLVEQGVEQHLALLRERHAPPRRPDRMHDDGARAPVRSSRRGGAARTRGRRPRARRSGSARRTRPPRRARRARTNALAVTKLAFASPAASRS